MLQARAKDLGRAPSNQSAGGGSHGEQQTREAHLKTPNQQNDNEAANAVENYDNQRRKVKIARWVGLQGSCKLQVQQNEIWSDKLVTVAAPEFVVKLGQKAYYEIEIKPTQADQPGASAAIPTGILRVGWATFALAKADQESEEHLGKVLGSWGVDGIRQVSPDAVSASFALAAGRPACVTRRQTLTFE